MFIHNSMSLKELNAIVIQIFAIIFKLNNLTAGRYLF